MGDEKRALAVLSNRKPKRAFAALGTAAGLALVSFELRRFGSTGSVERWFWLGVGGLLVVLGLMELLAPARPNE